MKDEQVRELLYQALETELGGVEVYTNALQCVENDELKEEWEKYLEQTQNHVQIMQDVLTKLGLDPNEETPGREVVRNIGEALVSSMQLALSEGDRGAAQLVAAESVVLAETKDHQNWHLIGEVIKKAKGELAKTLKEAHDQVEDEKMSISITPRAGRENSGSSHWDESGPTATGRSERGRNSDWRCARGAKSSANAVMMSAVVR
jgi:rubrerythrin